MQFAPVFAALNLDLSRHIGTDLSVRSPRDGQMIATLKTHTTAQAESAIADAHTAFQAWRQVPAPVRGELVRLLGEVLREHREELGQLVTLESGKILSEGIGEVQEMIDICDFAVGLSRQLYGLTIASERPGHRMMETWHPLGVCGVITAFNFPVAVWAWNAALALVCGNTIVWKPSEKTPVVALAVQALLAKAVARFAQQRPNTAPAHLNQVLIGHADIGEALSRSPLVPLVSATGSVRMGRQVASVVALVHVMLPFMVIPVWTALQRLDPTIEQAALSLNASQATVMRRILLPQILPGVLSGSLIVFGLSASAFAIPGLLGGRRLKMVATTVYDEFLGSLNWPLGASIVVVLLVANLIIMMTYNRILERKVSRTLG